MRRIQASREHSGFDLLVGEAREVPMHDGSMSKERQSFRCQFRR
jgi:hypothetical protein